MSEILSKKSTVTESLGGSANLGGSQAPSTPVKVWAFFGGALLLFQIYVWTRWVTGPYFVRVPAGPTDPPTYMKVMLLVNCAFMVVGFPAAVWWFLIRPWLRERRVTLDGMLFVSCALFFFQDPLLNYSNTWCTYNMWLWNRGSWTSNIPSWISPESPGHQVGEPLPINMPGYGLVLVTLMVGCFAMKKIKQRWPDISNFRLVLATYVFCFFFDFVMEGLILLPIGLFVYPGAIQAVSFNAGTYYQWPVYEGLMWGAVMTALCCLRFFTDDRGRTVVERGLDHVRGGVFRQQLVRFLAIFAACSGAFFFFYNVPAQWFGLHADPWPEDVQKRSYFSQSVCDENTPCPNPVLPIPTKRSGYIDVDGKLVLPPGKEMPKDAPVQIGK